MKIKHIVKVAILADLDALTNFIAGVVALLLMNGLQSLGNSFGDILLS